MTIKCQVYSDLALAVLVAFPAAGTTITIRPDGSGDYVTIQAAIDAAADGDVVELTDGTFTGPGNRAVDFMGKAITIRSQSGNAEACVVDCQRAGSGFKFLHHEGRSAVLQSVKIVNGFGVAGGIGCSRASPTITGCIFENNEGEAGGGIDFSLSGSLVSHCRFLRNHADAGGALYCTYATDLQVEDCWFEGNSAVFGAALYVQAESPFIANCTFTGHPGSSTVFSEEYANPRFLNCTFAGNRPGLGYIIECYYLSNVTLDNCIIASNPSTLAVYCYEEAAVTLSCCDLYGNLYDWTGCIQDQAGIRGNLSADPLFCDAERGDYTIAANSPCAPEENPTCGLIGAWPVACGGPVGACCQPDGACSLTVQSDCPGQWLGEAEVCDPNPCPEPTGACCHPGGVCSLATGVECQDQWLGGGTVCDPNPCSGLIGACCLPTGACEIRTHVACSDPEEIYLGDGTDCDPILCPPSPTEVRSWGRIKAMFRERR